MFHQTEIIKTESACFFMFVNKRKMPENCDFDENEAAEFIDNAGISKNTKYCKEKAQSHFMDYVKSNFPVDDVNGKFWEDKIKLEKALIQYFSTYRKKNGDLPKKNTLDATRSHIKMMILNDTKSVVDILNGSQFPDFTKFWKGLLGKLKSSGKLDTDHYDSMTEDEYEKMNELFKTLFKLMQLNESSDEFKLYLAKIPTEWQDCYNYLAMYGAICLLVWQVSFFNF